MSDLQIIQKIADEINVPFIEMSAESLVRDFQEDIRGYCLNECDAVVGLRINNTIFSNSSLISELTKLETLILRFNNINDFRFLKRLENLRDLRLSAPNVTDFSFLRELSNLTSLYLSHNKFSDVSILKDLKNLTSLYLRGNDIIEFTPLKDLKGLRWIDLCYDNLCDISFLEDLKGLTSLCLSCNKITDISSLKELKGLTVLDLCDNYVSDVSFLKELKGLTSLNLSNNLVSDISFLKELKGLTSVILEYNGLLSVSVVLDLPNLYQLSLEQAKVTDLPKIYYSKYWADIEGIRSFYRQTLKKTDTLYEAKVLLVGEPAAGKTSLMKRLTVPEFKVDPSAPEASTLGIDVHMNWPFEFNDRIFKAHLWDFGGQQIQYYIHQFFLTEDALYILVLDDRKESPNIDYWFQIIHLLGKESPVLVVRNRKNIEAATGFDWNKYQTRYKDSLKILDYEDIDLYQEDERFGLIESKIKKMAVGLKHVGQELPASWLGVRQEIIDLKDRNHISVGEFKAICRRYEIEEEVDQLALCNYLNALGILLHFRNDEALFDTVFVNPAWISRAVYMILSDKDIEKRLGRFEKSLLFEKWGKDYSFEEKNRLLTLMQKREFDLIYPVEHDGKKSDVYIAPILLSDVAPDEANLWDKKGSLSFQYRYQFMPMGIVTRLTVRLNDWIDTSPGGTDLVWKSGVILAKDRCRALVKTDLTKEGLNIIDISVTGERISAKELLSLICGTVDAVHKQSFKEVNVERLVPCTCAVCRQSDAPTMFGLSRLESYLKDGRFTILCENGSPFREVSIEELVGGIAARRPREDDFGFDRPRDPADWDLSTSDRLFQSLFELLRRQSPRININVDDHSTSVTTGDNSEFHGDFIVAGSIQNSFNKIRHASNLPPELKTLLEQLARAVEKATKSLPPDNAEQLSNDLSSFTNEVTGKNPRRGKWTSSLEDIKEAVQGVEDVSAAVIALATKIVPLLPM